MAIALISLAVLQYKWLGSVSDAEKERLEESVSASSENFVSDFNEVFTELSQAFRIQVSDPNDDIKPALGISYQNWIENSDYPTLIDSLYVVKKKDKESIEVFSFSTDPNTLTPIFPTPSIQEWLSNDDKNLRLDNRRGALHQTAPDLGNPSFLEIPIQFLDMIQVSNREFGKNIEVQLSLDQLDDVILLKLNDDYLKNVIIPKIARVYFSDSFDDQYTLSLVRKSEPLDIYFTTSENQQLPQPDFSTSLNRFSFDNILVFKSNNIEIQNSSSFLGIDDSMKVSFLDSRFESNISDSGSNASHIISQKFISKDNSDEDVSGWNVQRDTTIRASFTSSLGSTPWQLWLSFKDGSLDAFVDKTRNRNLIISFGILSILGISVVLIVIFSQRSRELAEQQMLFVAGVSHELRTPITVIRSAAENLTAGIVNDEERKNQYAHLMLKEGRRLSDMVDQIMEFSGIQSGKRVYHFRDLNLNDLLNSIKEESRHRLDEEGKHLEYSINTKLEVIQADPDAIFLSIMNLINNAIKFSGESNKILLKVDEIMLKGKPALRIQVQDFGIGIPEKEQYSVFKPFFRGEKPVNDQVKGNGIGLSLVQKVAIAHKGEVALKSKIGEGSTFSLILPLGELDV